MADALKKLCNAKTSEEVVSTPVATIDEVKLLLESFEEGFLNEKEKPQAELVLYLVNTYISKRDTKQANLERQAALKRASSLSKKKMKPRLQPKTILQYQRERDDLWRSEG